MTVKPKFFMGVGQTQGWNTLNIKGGPQGANVKNLDYMFQIIMGAYQSGFSRHGEIAARLKMNQLVPIYTPAMHIAKYGVGVHFFRRNGKLYRFEVPRPEGMTGELRKSVMSVAIFIAGVMEFWWSAAHAKYVSKDSPFANPYIKEALTPGTTLFWTRYLSAQIMDDFLTIMHEEFFRRGLQHHFIKKGYLRTALR